MSSTHHLSSGSTNCVSCTSNNGPSLLLYKIICIVPLNTGSKCDSCQWDILNDQSLEMRKYQDKITIKRIFGCYWSTFRNESRIIRSLIHMMGPYQETTTCSASTYKIMSVPFTTSLRLFFFAKLTAVWTSLSDRASTPTGGTLPCPHGIPKVVFK